MAVRREAGLPELRFKDLRHVFAKSFLDGGGSLKELGAVLGHTNQDDAPLSRPRAPDDAGAHVGRDACGGDPRRGPGARDGSAGGRGW